jgi:hypothetical protein
MKLQRMLDHIPRLLAVCRAPSDISDCASGGGKLGIAYDVGRLQTAGDYIARIEAGSLDSEHRSDDMNFASMSRVRKASRQ